MGPIAKGFVLRMLAAAPRGGFGGGDFRPDGLVARAGMGAVTEGLRL